MRSSYLRNIGPKFLFFCQREGTVSLVTRHNLTGYKPNIFCTRTTVCLILPPRVILWFEIKVYESQYSTFYQKAIRLHFCKMDVQAFKL